MVSLLDNAASGGLLADPRPAILAQLFDMSVKKRPTFLPMFTQQNGRIGLTAPQLLVDVVNSAMLPYAAAQGYRATPTDVSKMALDTMLGGGLLGRAPSGSLAVNVFHGTPHKFAPEPGFPYGRPRLDKMGTGEGAQVYGPGFYTAEAREVGTSYRDDLTSLKRRMSLDGELLPTPSAFDAKKVAKDFNVPESDASYLQAIVDDMHSSVKGGDVNSYIASRKSMLDLYPENSGDEIVDMLRGSYEAQIRVAEKYKDRLKPATGSLYKLDIPDADAAKTLDWDAPLSEQPKHIKKAWADFKKSELGILADESLYGSISAGRANYSNPTGKDIYGAFVEGAATKVGEGKWAEKADYDLAVKTLREAGIPGVKYLDQGSRGAGEGSRNYAIWDQDVLDRTKMLERDGEILGLLD